MKSFILPAGLRLEVIDNENLIVDVGARATLQFDHDVLSGAEPIVLIDGDSMNGCVPLGQCKIITDNFNNLNG